MAVSLKGVLYQVGLDSNEFKTGSKAVQAERQKLERSAKKYADAIANLNEKERRAHEATLRARKALDAALASGKSEQAIEKLKSKLLSLEATEKKSVEKRIAAEDLYNAKLKGITNNLVALERKASVMDFAKGFGAVAGVAGVAFAALSKVANELDAIAKSARDVGLSASQFQEFQHQAKLAGVETTSLDGALKTFTKNISLAHGETGKAVSTLKDMGIALKDANGASRSQSEILKDVANYFSQNATNAKAAGQATKLFGDEGARMIQIFSDAQNIDAIFNAQGIDLAARNAEKFNDALEQFGNKAKQVSFVVGGTFLTAANVIIDLFKGISVEERIALDRAKEADSLKQDSIRSQMELEAQQAQAAQAFADALAKRDKAIADARKKYNFDQLSTSQQINVLQNQNADLTAKINDAEKGSSAQLRLIAEQTKVLLDLDILRRKQKDEIADAEKKEVAERLAAAKKQADIDKQNFDAQTKAIADEIREQDKLQAQSQAREEFELQIAIAEARAKGDAENLKILNSKKEQIELEKQAVEYAQKYGYSLDEARKKAEQLKQSQAQATSGGAVQYSAEARAQAQKIIARGADGTVGQKTLEQAQAIMSGQAIKGKAVAMFDKLGVSGGAGSSKGTTIDATGATPTVKTGASSQGSPVADGSQSSQASTLQQILEVLQQIPTTLQNIFAE